MQQKDINKTENNIKYKQNEISWENMNQEIYLRKEHTIITHIIKNLPFTIRQ